MLQPRLRQAVLLLTFASTSLVTALEPEDFLAQRFIGAPNLAADGRLVAYAVSESRVGPEESSFHTEIWISTTAGSGSYQLTRSPEGAFDPRFSPNPEGSLLAFRSSRGGDGVQIWLIRPELGEAWQLTYVDGGVGDFRFSPDGREIAFLVTDPKSAARQAAEKAMEDVTVVDAEPRYQHLYRVAVAPQAGARDELRRLTSGDFHVSAFDYSPDGKRLIVVHQPTPHLWGWRQTDLSLLDVESGEMSPLVRHPGMDLGAVFSPDGRTVAFLSNRGVETWARDWRLCLIPADGGEVTVLPRTWDSMPGFMDDYHLAWAADGSGIYYSEFERTSHHLFFAPADGTTYRRISPHPGFNLGFDLVAAGGLIAYVGEDYDAPAEVWILDTTNGEKRAVSRVNAALPPLPAAPTREVRWRSFDGLEIEGILHLPAGEKDGPWPLLVHLHGGPTSAFFREYAFQHRLLGEQGFAVLRVNPRGSTAYGVDFRLANLRDWGGKDVRDVLAGVDHLVAEGIADPDRLGVFGGSYGGFLTAMTISRTRRFKAAVVTAGTANLVSFAGTSDLDGFDQSFLESEPWENPELWHDRSAVSHAGEITTPTLILHGEEDARVPVSQGYELHTALRRAGVPVEMVVYPRAGHGPSEPKQIVEHLRRQSAWFTRWLLTPDAALSPAPSLPPELGRSGV